MENYESRRYRSLFWPVLLIGLGAVWLLSNLGMIDNLNFAILLRLWPLLLIMLGVDLLFARRIPWLGALIGAIAAGVVIFLLINGDQLGLTPNVEIKTEQFSESADGVKSAKVDLDLSLGKTTISSLNDSSNLIEATLTHIGTINFVSRGEEEKFVTLNDTSTFSTDYLNMIGEVDTLHWDVGLANDIPLDLDIEGGFGNVDLNLQDMQLTKLAVNIGAGEVDISLPAKTFNTTVNGGAGNFNMAIPANAEVKVDISGGVGAVNIDIENNAVVELNIEGGVGSFTVDIPDEAAVRVEAETGIGNIDVPNWFDQLNRESGGPNENGVWQTPDYNEAEKQIFITFSGGVGNLDIE